MRWIYNLNNGDTLKTYTANKKVSSNLKNIISDLLVKHKKYSSSFVWTPGKTASARRKNEREFRLNMQDFDIETQNGLIKIRSSYNESCANCYYKMDISLKNNQKDIRFLRKLIN